MKMMKNTLVNIVDGSDILQQLHFDLDDFDEHISIKPNFSRVKVLRQHVQVIPHQTVSNNSTSTVSAYCIAAYHRPMPNSIAWGQMISTDRIKIRSKTQGVRMSFVPACRVGAEAGVPEPNFQKLEWRPTFDLGGGATDNTSLYTGYIGFQGVPDAASSSRFTIIETVYCLYSEQRNFI